MRRDRATWADSALGTMVVGSTAVLTSTSPALVRRAKSLLARIIPFGEWVKRPQSLEDRVMYTRIVRELGAIIAGHRPDEITIVTRRRANPTPTKKQIEKNRGA